MGVKGRQASGRCATHVDKPSYDDLERALILGHKRRLNINFLKDAAFTMIPAALTRRSPKLEPGAGIEGGFFK
jgi:hypothetical protein